MTNWRGRLYRDKNCQNLKCWCTEIELLTLVLQTHWKLMGLSKTFDPTWTWGPLTLSSWKSQMGFVWLALTWHCQVEKVKWVLYGLRRVKRKGSGEVFPEQESLAVYRISKGSCTWQKCKGTMNWNKIWNLNRNVDRIGELYWAKMGRKYKLTFANFGK